MVNGETRPHLPDEYAVDAELTETGGDLRLFARADDVVGGGGRVHQVHQDIPQQ